MIARRVGGEPALPQQGPWVLLSPERLVKHALVLGATGAGKTETLLRLAWTVAHSSDARVFYLDGKGDRENAQRFTGLMADAGREARVFPNQPFDMWRGQPHEIHGRLMEIIDYATEGAGAWYRDLASSTLRLVCNHPDGPPRSSHQLLQRMEHDAIELAHPGSTAAQALSEEQVNQVRLRYEAFFGQAREQLDGTWAWEDTNAAYVMLDTLALGEETAGLARCLFTDFSHYFTTRKARNQLCLMIVDEFAALSRGGGMAARVEQARGFNTALVLAPQVVEGIGGREETARILGSVQTVIAHRVNTPHEVVKLAGTRQRPELSTRLNNHGLTGERVVRLTDQLTVDPNKLQALPPGVAYLISEGRAMRAQILQAPHLTAPLPQSESRLDCGVLEGGVLAQPVGECDALPF